MRRSMLALLASAFLFQVTSLSSPQDIKPAELKAALAIETELGQKLLKVRRIYVDTFGDDAIARQMQAMVISSLAESKRFIITEDKGKADAVLKGSAVEKTSQELHAFGEATSVAGAAGSHSGSFSGNASSVSGSHSGGFVGRAAGVSDSSANTETINDARLAVRLVSADSDVIWTTTQESHGAKYKGASADVADKITKQLLHDLEKAEKGPASAATPGQELEKK